MIKFKPPRESLLCLTANFSQRSCRLYLISLRNGRLSHPHSKRKLEKLRKIAFSTDSSSSSSAPGTPVSTSPRHALQHHQSAFFSTASNSSSSSSIISAAQDHDAPSSSSSSSSLDFVFYFWKERKIRFVADSLENKNKFIAKLLGVCSEKFFPRGTKGKKKITKQPD